MAAGNRRPGRLGGALRHHVAARDQRPGPIDLEDHAHEAEMDAHGAAGPVGQDGGRIGDMAPVRADRPLRLPPQARQRFPALRPCGQKTIREIGVVISGMSCSSWARTNDRARAQPARVQFGSDEDGSGYTSRFRFDLQHA
jgi:hypothetical protein